MKSTISRGSLFGPIEGRTTILAESVSTFNIQQRDPGFKDRQKAIKDLGKHIEYAIKNGAKNAGNYEEGEIFKSALNISSAIVCGFFGISTPTDLLIDQIGKMKQTSWTAHIVEFEHKFGPLPQFMGRDQADYDNQLVDFMKDRLVKEGCVTYYGTPSIFACDKTLMFTQGLGVTSAEKNRVPKESGSDHKSDFQKMDRNQYDLGKRERHQNTC